MRAFQVVMAVLSVILVAFSLICGFWIHNAGKAVTDYASSVNFHMWLAIAAFVSVLVTGVVTIVRK